MPSVLRPLGVGVEGLSDLSRGQFASIPEEFEDGEFGVGQLAGAHVVVSCTDFPMHAYGVLP